MRYLVTAVLVLTSLEARGDEAEPGPARDERRATVLLGVGNTLGQLGAQGEVYVARERISLCVGIGFSPEFESGDPSGVAFAVGVRGFTRGARHRGFLEVSVSQVAVETLSQAGQTISGRRLYGPGVQIGYQYVAPGGFTALVSAGVGYAVDASPGLNKAVVIGGLGLGYTGRR